MIAYICDFCEEVIPYGADRYLIKTVNATHKQIPPTTICLCNSCKTSWQKKIPQLFAFEQEGDE